MQGKLADVQNKHFSILVKKCDDDELDLDAKCMDEAEAAEYWAHREILVSFFNTQVDYKDI